MKKLFLTLLISLFLIFLWGCKTCDKSCGSGTLDEDNCKCNCPTGFYGNECQNTDVYSQLHAAVVVDGTISFDYDPPSFDLFVYDHATDTLWIDGYNDLEDTYCFLRLYVADHTTIHAGSKFPIGPSQAVGTCWGAFKDPSININPFHAKADPGDTLTITEYNPGTSIKGKFSFHAQTGASVAFVDGFFNK